MMTSRRFQDGVFSLLLVALALLSSMIAMLTVWILLLLAEVSPLVHKGALLSSIILLALAQPHFVRELARRFRVATLPNRTASFGTAVTSIRLLVLGAVVSRLM